MKRIGKAKYSVHLSAVKATVAVLMLAFGAAGADFYTNDTDWAGADWTLADGDVIAGSHTNIGYLLLPAEVTVTIQPYAADATNMGRVAIFAASADISGTLSASGAGFPYNQGPGRGYAGTGYSSGAGHGGRGSLGPQGRPGDFYGDPFAPDTLGSGGAQDGTYGNYKQSGGGAILIDVTGALAVGGTLSANGNNGTSRSSGGSGGSIWLRAATVSGGGSILADGGSAADLSRGSGGGGGRIAIDSTNILFNGIIRAEGKPGIGRSYHGTFNFSSGADKDLVIADPIALPPGTNWLFRSLTVQPGVRFDIQSTPGTAAESYTNEVATRIRVLGSVDIPAEATLSADGQGYIYNVGPGASTSHNDGCGGGTYGGRGGMGAGGVPRETYGNPNAPDRIGSGGGGTGGTEGYGGNGAGAVILDVGGSLTVNGTLSANGDKSNSRGGGGSGGSVWLAATTLTGSGAILADGGVAKSASYGGGGGGGRIAFEVENDSFTGTIRAKGQPGSCGKGRSGTFNFSPDETRDLVISNDIALPPGTNWVFRSLTVTNGAIFEIQSLLGTGALTYTNEIASRLFLVNDLIVASNATVSASGLGYRYSSGSGAGTGGANGGPGGSYGGKGGKGGQGTVQSEYGDPITPDRLGSGGYGSSSVRYGGAGGGALLLTAGRAAIIEGSLTAQGGHAQVGFQGGGRAAGGSGGSIWIMAPTIHGQGPIGADGGNGNTDGTKGGGGGAGGRILLTFGNVADLEKRANDALITETKPDILRYDGTVTVDGGTGFTPGNSGTIRYLYLPPPTGSIFMIR